MKSYLLILGLAVAVSSCTKEQHQTVFERGAGTAVATTALPVTTPANPSNPYDSVGRLHNAGLDYIHALQYQTGDTSWAAAQKYLALFCRDSLHRAMTTGTIQPHLLIVDRDSSLLMKSIQQLPYSSVLKAYAHQLISIINDSVSLSNLPVFKSRIIELEKGIQVSTSLTPMEQTVLMKATSVARYSAAYWMAKAKQKNPSKQCWFCHWYIWNTFVILHDVTGILLTGSVDVAVGFSEFSAEFLEAARTGYW